MWTRMLFSSCDVLFLVDFVLLSNEGGLEGMQTAS